MFFILQTLFLFLYFCIIIINTVYILFDNYYLSFL